MGSIMIGENLFEHRPGTVYTSAEMCPDVIRLRKAEYKAWEALRASWTAMHMGKPHVDVRPYIDRVNEIKAELRVR